MAAATITAQIKMDKMKVFRRLYMKRRVSGGDYEADWQQVDPDKIMKFGSIQYSVDDVKPNFYKYGALTFELSNRNGTYSDVTDDKSFFFTALTRHQTLVKLEAGYTDPSTGTEYPTNPTLFLGLIGEDMIYKENATISFKTNHISYVLDKFPADRIAGMAAASTAKTIIERIRDHQDGSAVAYFQKFISTAAWNITSSAKTYTLATDTSLQNISCWKLIQKLAGAENHVTYIDQFGSFFFVERGEITATSKFHFSGFGDTDHSYGHNILNVTSVDENIRKVFNRVRVKIGNDNTTTNYHIRDETWNWGDSSSSFMHGIRELKYDNDWIDTATAITIADDFYTEFKWPKDEIKLKTKFVPQLMVQNRVDATAKTRRYEGDALYGYAIWNQDVYGERFGYNIFLSNTNAKITNIRHNVDNFTTDVVLREI